MSLVKAAPNLPRRPSQAAFERLHASMSDDLASLAKKLVDGRLSPREWYDRFYDVLQERHTDSWVLGRWLGGDDSKPDHIDELAGRAMADQESAYLRDFLDKVESGGYLTDEGHLNLLKINWRSQLYTGKLRGTSNEAFIESSPDDDLFIWKLGAVAEDHCSDCPTLAAMSPWLKDELGTWPGSGGQPCLGNCKCSLVRESDGFSGFKPV